MSDLLQKIVGQSAPLTRVRVPEWDTDLYFGTVTGADRVAIRRGINPKAEEELLISSLQRLARDKAGNPVFAHDQKTRVELLKGANMGVVMRVLYEAGVETSPRQSMIEGAEVERLRAALRLVGDLSADAEADLSDDVIEAMRRMMLAREPDLADALQPGGAPEPGASVKNA